MDVTISSVYKPQFEYCAALIRESFLTVANDFGLTVENCPTNGAFLQADRLAADMEKGNLLFGLFEKGRMVGFMELERSREGHAILEKLAVLPACRHRGYGRHLLLYAKETARDMGARKLLVAIIEENTVLKQWYLDNSFVHTGTKKFNHLPFTVGFLECDIIQAEGL